ncbi:hypothetical protein H5410_001653 [Solanum commersonii]|uniref:Uncharacterized protein n=1 Tax=Solanum commersonii TaxID=4109 RepID=A0A9J6AZM4_SOLCO|nr:hypothetical protein H5410_001653 [Solanum commersonii]
MNTFINNNKKFNKKKVVFIMGATGMGKSCLSIYLAAHFRVELMNSDKMQVYNCFIWIDVEQLVLNRGVDTRVDERSNADRDDESKKMIPQTSISSIKHNTPILICYQLDKIQRLINEKLWLVHQIIASDVFEEDRKEVVDEALRNTVLQPCLAIVKRFL